MGVSVALYTFISHEEEEDGAPLLSAFESNTEWMKQISSLLRVRTRASLRSSAEHLKDFIHAISDSFFLSSMF